MTKGQIEAAVTEALTRFERDHLGREPKQARSFIIQDMCWHASQASATNLIDSNGLADAVAEIDRFLLLLLLTTRVLVNTESGEAWLRQDDVEKAVQRPRPARGH